MATSFMGNFAAGLVNGYVKGTQMKQAQEEHDMRMQRAKDEKDMHDALKAATGDASVQNQYTVTAADGSTMTTDTEDSAAKIAKGMDGAKVAQVFSVGDQKFNTQAEADKAAFMANDPVNKAQRVAAIYNRFGHPDQAMSVMQGANALQDLRAKDTFSSINKQIDVGDYGALSKTYGQMMGDPSIQITAGKDGSVLVTRAGEGGTPTLMHAYKTADDFKAASATALTNSPKEMLAQHWLQKNFDATQDYRKQQLANQSQELGLSAQRVGIAQTEANNRAGALAAEAAARKAKALKDDNPVHYVTGLGADGKLVTVPMQGHFDPQTNQWTTTAGAPIATGVKPNRADPYAFLGGGAGGAGGMTLPANPTPEQIADFARRLDAARGAARTAAAPTTPAAPAPTAGPAAAPAPVAPRPPFTPVDRPSVADTMNGPRTVQGAQPGTGMFGTGVGAVVPFQLGNPGNHYNPYAQ